jgi:hypothetical protein
MPFWWLWVIVPAAFLLGGFCIGWSRVIADDLAIMERDEARDAAAWLFQEARSEGWTLQAELDRWPWLKEHDLERV